MGFHIQESVIREVRERADIVETISSCGVELKRAGVDFVALCPFHHEKTPSFHVHPNTGFYKCFGCQKSGESIAFLQEYNGMTFIDAVTTLAQKYGIDIKHGNDETYNRRKRLYSLMSGVCDWYRQVLNVTKEAQIARDYLQSRDLSNEVQSSFSIGYAAKNSDHILTWANKHGFTVEELRDAGIIKIQEGSSDNVKPYHRFAGRLMFAIKDSAGRVVGFSGRQFVQNKKSGKYVNSPETEIFKKGNILYGLDKSAPHITKSPHREAILCEGQIDCIRLHSSGFPVAVAPQGTAFTPEHASVLKRYADSAVIVFDDDQAGHKASIKASGILFALGMPVRVISLPDGDDPDTFLKSNSKGKGPEGFKKLFDNAESAISFMCRVLRENETTPDSVDAKQRISKAVLDTISLCKNSILKDSLLSEASSVLGIPKDILQDEVGNSKVKPIVPKNIEEIEQYTDNDDLSSDQSDSDTECLSIEVFPSNIEFSFLTALSCCEGNEEVKSFLSNALKKAPQLLSKFSCDFVRNFISAFLSREVMPLAAFAETLSPKERPWFDKIMSSIGSCESYLLKELNPVDVIRSLLLEIYRLPEINGINQEATDNAKN